MFPRGPLWYTLVHTGTAGTAGTLVQWYGAGVRLSPSQPLPADLVYLVPVLFIDDAAFDL